MLPVVLFFLAFQTASGSIVEVSKKTPFTDMCQDFERIADSFILSVRVMTNKAGRQNITLTALILLSFGSD